MFIITSITALCLAIHLAKDEWHYLEAELAVSANRLPTICRILGGPIPETGNHWSSLVTSLFAHYGRFHLLHNMIMLWTFGPQIEEYLGSMYTLAFFLIAGITGWLFKFLYQRLAQKDMWMIGVAQYQSTVGASPSTYAMLVLASLLDLKGTGTALGLEPWVWLSLQVLAPKFMGDKYGVDLLCRPSVSWCRAVFVAIVAGGCSFALLPLVLGPTPPASTMALGFCIGVFIFMLVDYFILGQDASSGTL